MHRFARLAVKILAVAAVMTVLYLIAAAGCGALNNAFNELK